MFWTELLLLFSCSAMSNSLPPHGLQHGWASLSFTISGGCSNTCPLSWWCHPIISSSVIFFSSLLQSFPTSGSFPMRQLFASGGQRIQLLSHVQLFVTPWTTALQASLSITNAWGLLKLISIELVMPSNHLTLCHPLLLLPSIFPSIRVF